jgi:hypothetical protein
LPLSLSSPSPYNHHAVHLVHYCSYYYHYPVIMVTTTQTVNDSSAVCVRACSMCPQDFSSEVWRNVYGRKMFLLPIVFRYYVYWKVKLPLCLIKHHVMKTYWGMEVWLHTFLTSVHIGQLYIYLHGFQPSSFKTLDFTLV